MGARAALWLTGAAAGNCFYCRVDGEDTHDARNVGTTRYRNLVIELKGPRPAS